MVTMRAAVLRGVHDLVIEERPVPRPGTGEVLVRVSAVGVCGSDVHYYEHGRIGDFVVESPMVLGHESSGVVEAVGDEVAPERVDQRVSIEPGVPDLTCEHCLAGRYNLCPAIRFYATPPIDGSLAEFAVVHASFAHPVPDTMSDDAWALLEPLSVGVWANRRVGTTAGSRVLVTGAGPVGLVAMQCAVAFGATEVVADLNPHRLALELGATGVIRIEETTIANCGVKPTVLLECSGHPGSTRDGIRAVARRAGGPRGHGRQRARPAALPRAEPRDRGDRHISDMPTPGPRPSTSSRVAASTSTDASLATTPWTARWTPSWQGNATPKPSSPSSTPPAKSGHARPTTIRRHDHSPREDDHDLRVRRPPHVHRGHARWVPRRAP